MNGKPGKDGSQLKAASQLRIARWLVDAKAKAGFRSPHFWIILLLLAAFTYLHYAVLRANYDVYLVLFFYPLVYAAVTYRLRGVIAVSSLVLVILLPYGILIMSDPYALVRVLLFGVFSFVIGILLASLLNYLEIQLLAFEEIESLNIELNRHIERLETTQKQLLQAEKLNAVGQLAASVAHEINNPMAGVLVYAKLLKKRLADGSLEKNDAAESLEKIIAAIDHCSHITKSLLDFARQSEPAFGPVKIDDVIGRVVTLVGHRAQMSQIRFNVVNLPSLPAILADARQLQQVFVNLVVNAIQAMPDGGELTIQGLVDEGGWLKVNVRDTGCGIEPANMDRLFEPFFTTRKQGEGTGLGLSISYGIIERHNGKIEVRSEGPGRGSTFTVCLPLENGG